MTAKRLMMLLCLLVALGCNGRKPSRGRGQALSVLAAKEETKYLLTASPSRIDMGEVAQGGRKQATFMLTNSGNEIVNLARIDTSCGCLSVDLPTHIAPGEQLMGRAKLDLHAEPNFTGAVGITSARKIVTH